MLAERLLNDNETYFECESYKAKNDELFRALQIFNNNKNKLNDMLNN